MQPATLRVTADRQGRWSDAPGHEYMKDHIKAPRSSLEDPSPQSPESSAVILQVGACLNALGAAGEWFELVQDAEAYPDRAGERSRLLAFLQICSYLKEAVDLYQGNRPFLNECAGRVPGTHDPTPEAIAKVCTRD